MASRKRPSTKGEQPKRHSRNAPEPDLEKRPDESPSSEPLDLDMTVVAIVARSATGESSLITRVFVRPAEPDVRALDLLNPELLYHEARSFSDAVESHALAQPDGSLEIPDACAASALSSRSSRLAAYVIAAHKLLFTSHKYRLAKVPAGESQKGTVPELDEIAEASVQSAVLRLLLVTGLDATTWNARQSKAPGAPHARWQVGEHLTAHERQLLRSAVAELNFLSEEAAAHSGVARRRPRKGGRPRKGSWLADQRVYEAWGSGTFTNFEDLGRQFRMSAGDAQRTVDRCRKRVPSKPKRSGKTPAQGPRVVPGRPDEDVTAFKARE